MESIRRVRRLRGERRNLQFAVERHIAFSLAVVRVGTAAFTTR